MKLSTLPPRILCAALVAGGAAFGVARWAPSLSGRAVGGDHESSSSTNPTAEASGEGTSTGNESHPPAGVNADRPSEGLFAPAIEDDEKDIFGAADEALSLIATLTPADFAEIARQRKLPTRIAACFETPFAEAAAQSFVERWLEVDPSGAHSAMLQMTRRVKGTGTFSYFETLRRALVRQGPAQYLAHIAQVPEFEDDYFVVAHALSQLARTQPEAARQMAAKLPVRLRGGSESSILLGLAGGDLVSAVRQAIQSATPESDVLTTALKAAMRAGPGRVREVLAEGGEELLRVADLAGLCVQYPEFATELKLPKGYTAPEWTASGWIADRLPLEELPRRLASSEAMPAALRSMVQKALLDTWTARAPEAAMSWSLTQSKPDAQEDGNSPVATVYEAWQLLDPNAAFTWWERLGDPKLKSALGHRAAVTAAKAGQVEQAMRMSATAVPAQLETIARLAVDKNPAMAARWLSALPAGGESRIPIQEAMWAWHERDAAAAESWAETLPNGGQRDFVAAAMARTKLANDPNTAAKWIGKIEAAELLDEIVSESFDLYRRADPVAARAWLRSAPGVSEELREELLAVRKKAAR